MAAPVSIVIPTLNATDGITPMLACLIAGVNAGLVRELIIVDGGSDDGIEQVAQDIGAKFITCEAGRGRQLAHGANVACAPWLLFVHADTVFDGDWPTVMFDHINNQSAAGYCRLSFDDTGIIARCVSMGANLRSRLFGLPYGDQGLLISRTLYDRVGGYSDMPLMEDVAMARALRGYLRRIDMTVITSAARYHHQGWVKRICKNLTLLARFKMGADPEKLARAYRR